MVVLPAGTSTAKPCADNVTCFSKLLALRSTEYFSAVPAGSADVANFQEPSEACTYKRHDSGAFVWASMTLPRSVSAWTKAGNSPAKIQTARARKRVMKAPLGEFTGGRRSA